MGISALRLSMPYHDIRRPAELERSDYSVSANIGRTLMACRQAVIEIRCCLDWLEEQGYEHFGVLGTSLGSCYAYLASAHDARIRVNAFNHASTAFGDVTWAGQSTRHVKQALEEAGLTQDRVRACGPPSAPATTIPRLSAPKPAARSRKFCWSTPTTTLISQRSTRSRWLTPFAAYGLNFEPRVLPCGHYTTGETPYKFIDGWYMGWFVYRALRRCAKRRHRAWPQRLRIRRSGRGSLSR